jgi:hypothetical protein
MRRRAKVNISMPFKVENGKGADVPQSIDVDSELIGGRSQDCGPV